MPQEYENMPELILLALSATNTAIQFCNSMIHEPMRVLAETLWDQECRKPMTGADIMTISKDDIRRGTDGMLYYIPAALHGDIRYAPDDDTGQVDIEENADIIVKSCRLVRTIARPELLDLHILRADSEQGRNGELASKLESMANALVQTARQHSKTGTTVVTMPQISVTHGETPIEVYVHMYCLMGGYAAGPAVNSGA